MNNPGRDGLRYRAVAYSRIPCAFRWAE